MKVAIILGTRPEIIKLSNIMRLCEKKKIEYFIVHTGQHYSYKMDKIFFDDLELPEVKYKLDVGSSTHGEQTAQILERLEKVLLKEKPSVVLVQGDTNTVLAGALAATKLGIKVGHVEAGLRSYDRHMPEEINRLLTDHISDFLFCPTEISKNIAIKENIDKNKIFVTGNTIVDAVLQNQILATKKSKILEKLNLTSNNYFLITAHRQENVDVQEKLRNLVVAFDRIYKKFKIPMIYPIHPRTKKMLNVFKIKIPETIKAIDPVGFIDFLKLEANAKLILTDSGGVQEEGCILKIPCVTLRENTERPETLQVGSNILAGTNPDRIIKAIDTMLRKKQNWKNPFGDGTASENILKILQKYVNKGTI
jgi:UDP-N-acetylglucosamine 2-epimerase (non-hydrolysing)